MSWANELYNVYENMVGVKTEGEQLLPLSHSTANAQIEVTLNEEGEILGADAIDDKSNAVTIIPVTEDSGARSSGITPMPYADKLIYIAGDYGDFTEGKNSDNSKHFDAYINQLLRWKESNSSHEAVEILYSYIKKGRLIHDLVSLGALKCDESGKLDKKRKIAGKDQEDSFVRFRINYKDLSKESRTWLDKTLYERFAAFNANEMSNRNLCYALGQELSVTYKHPGKIRTSGDKAKLISSNDEDGYTYRGRFRNKSEALSVSYEFSQKMHNALKWLIARQGMRFANLVVIVWASRMEELPDIRKSAMKCYQEVFDDEEINPDTEPMYAEALKKMIYGYKSKLSSDTKVMVLGVDSATTGRLSISMYSELFGSDFLDNIQSWHEQTGWYRYSQKYEKNIIDTFSVYEIIDYAYGREIKGDSKGKKAESKKQGKFDCDEKIRNEKMLQLIPCIIDGRPLPTDIVRTLFRRVSNPVAYEDIYNHRTSVEIACGMIKKSIIDKGGSVDMAYEPDKKYDRSYYYGCLLAIADLAESYTYEKKDRYERLTNAKRFWYSFSSRPYQTWQLIYERLQPYMNKLEGKRVLYEKHINSIMDKMTVEDFQDNSSLTPMYILGYNQYTNYMYKLMADKKENK